MLQRIQTLYLLAAFVSCLACLCLPVAHFTTDGGMEQVDMYNLWLAAEGKHLFHFCPVLMGILVITTAMVFLNVWLFARRTLQMRVCSFCMILLVAWYAAYGLISHLICSDLQASWRPHWATALPAVGFILLYLALRGILHDERLVRSLDRLR